jgi:hypothetical protein
VKLMLPPVNKIAAVAACRPRNMTCPAGPCPKTILASWARMVGNPASIPVSDEPPLANARAMM